MVEKYYRASRQLDLAKRVIDCEKGKYNIHFSVLLVMLCPRSDSGNKKASQPISSSERR